MFKLMFIFTLLFSIMLSMTMSSWFSMWLCMEINLLSFIPIMNYKSFYKNNYLPIKYFIIQTMSSSLYFFSTMSFIFFFNKNLMMIMFYIMNFTMLIKLSMFPFHMWFINMMNHLDWIPCMILTSIQKIIPLIIISNIFMEFKFKFIIILLNSIYSTINSMNQFSLKLIMAYSSINHSSWMLWIMMMNEFMMIKYFIIYNLISLKIMMLINYLKMNYVNEIYHIYQTPYIKIKLTIIMLSISGLPPMFGFTLKWFFLKTMMINLSYTFMTLSLLINSIMLLMTYIQILIPNLIHFSYNKKYINMNKRLNLNNPMMLNMILISSYYLMWNYLLQ